MAFVPPQAEELQRDYLKLASDFDSLLMATCNASGLPEASYAAYLENEGSYYVYLSELASHTQNLTENPRCSVLFIENEQDAGHLFARRRVTYQCDSEEFERGSPYFESIMDLFENKFGDFIKVLRRLEDFHLFRLKPKQGKYVAGFAQAYEMSGDELKEVKHRNEKGHRRANPSPEKSNDKLSLGL